LHLIGGHFTGSLTRHVFESLAHHAAICLHIRLIEGRDPHHVVEAQFKALARALRAACAYDGRVLDIPSTKGALSAPSTPGSSAPTRWATVPRAAAAPPTTSTPSSRA